MYVEMNTNTMMERHGGHWREIKELNTPIGRHFTRCGITNLTMQINAGLKEGEENS